MWYEENPELLSDEISLIKNEFPNAEQYILPNKKITYRIDMPIVVKGRVKIWTLLAVYNDDYPQIKKGDYFDYYPIKIYPVKPNFSEIQLMINNSKVLPHDIFRMMRDDNNQIFFATNWTNDYRFKKEGRYWSCTRQLRLVKIGITLFENGLINQNIWSELTKCPMSTDRLKMVCLKEGLTVKELDDWCEYDSEIVCSKKQQFEKYCDGAELVYADYGLKYWKITISSKLIWEIRIEDLIDYYCNGIFCDPKIKKVLIDKPHFVTLNKVLKNIPSQSGLLQHFDTNSSLKNSKAIFLEKILKSFRTNTILIIVY